MRYTSFAHRRNVTETDRQSTDEGRRNGFVVTCTFLKAVLSSFSSFVPVRQWDFVPLLYALWFTGCKCITGERVLTNLLNICDPHTCYLLLTHNKHMHIQYMQPQKKVGYDSHHHLPSLSLFLVSSREIVFICCCALCGIVLSIQMLKLWSTAVT